MHAFIPDGGRGARTDWFAVAGGDGRWRDECAVDDGSGQDGGRESAARLPDDLDAAAVDLAAEVATAVLSRLEC